MRVSLFFAVVVVAVIIEEVSLLLLLKEVVTLELFKGAAVVVPLLKMVVIEALEVVPKVLSTDGVNRVPVELVDALLVVSDVDMFEEVVNEEEVVVFFVVVNCDDPFKFIMRFFLNFLSQVGLPFTK